MTLSPRAASPVDNFVAPPIWQPQPGPQEKAIRAQFIPELFFGGARGGGKTSFLMGDYASDVQKYGSAWRGIVLRRSFPELDEVIEEGKRVLYPAFPGTEYKVGVHEFRIPHATGNVILRLRHMESESDADNYQGHCTAQGTPVLMADGDYRPIEAVNQGDMVMTLQGPRRVTRTWGAQQKECVDVRLDGTPVLQSHPVDHRLLTPFSWQSYASLLDNGATKTCRSSRESSRPPCVSTQAILAAHIPGGEHPTVPRYVDYAKQTPVDAARYVYWTSNNTGDRPPDESSLGDLQRVFEAYQENSPDESSIPFGDGAYGPIGWQRGADFPVDYQTSHRLSDAQSQLHSAIDPGDAPSPGGAVAHAHEDCRPDAPDSTPEHTPSASLWYDHPYTGELLSPLLQTSSAALEMTPCGVKTVYDLTVEEVNHYITTKQHLVNKNSYSWIAFDELPNWPNLGGYNKLKACLRSAAGIEHMRIRATGNPGGIGHQAVKQYFIDAGPPETIIQDEQSKIPRMWIKSLVTDNKILLDNDPGYIDRLRSVGDPELVRAWLDGDWNVSLGAYFTNWDTKYVSIPSFEIPEHWPLFGGLDYGETSPTSFGLYTVDFDGHIYRLCEYYLGGATATSHAYEIDKIVTGCPFTNGRKPSQIFADPSMWVKRQLHEATANVSPADVFREQGLNLTKANNDRITGWRVINDLLSQRKLHCFSGWNDNMERTMPSLPRSKTNPEDLDTKSEDHAADELRYAVMHLYQPSRGQPSANANPFVGNNVLGKVPVKKKRRYA